ncbi:putative leucine-rich repeat-containing protein DDB_G0290503 [Penaeus chinensis]|uniref:putative leucine-rich repeat-containing protein DDB_G0290503 n=1 Tax=Penaeus chinensis TaxID=139456 RepID=UPI001FB6AD88|nr:putative leucine-rich repeat-containing protein DDB_G0290503 [Penaeus chinensis]XP_047489927.1 putative leucine-rich repeat-containing protein DDB_G0290503 [Penaeus chinensis]
MDCVWACTKMMDRPRKRVRGRCNAARLRRVIPATRKHVSGASLPILSVPASPGHSEVKTQESSTKDHDSNGTTHIEVVLSCTEDQNDITSPVEAEETSSTTGCISGPTMVCRDLELSKPTCKTEPCKFKASSEEEYEDPVKKLRVSDTEYKQELSVGGNINGKCGLQIENTLRPENQSIYLKSVLDQHSGRDNVTSAMKLGEEIADNMYGQHHENNQSVDMEGVHYDDDNGISFVKPDEKNAESTDVQHNEKENEISSLMLVGNIANDAWDKHQGNNTLADTTIEQHGEKNCKISSIMLEGQNADYSNSLHNVDNVMSSAEFSRKTAGIGSCTSSSEIGHIPIEAEILNKSQMLIKKKIKRVENICNSDNVKEGVIRKQDVINTPSVKYIEDSVVTEEKKTDEKIENKSKEGNALALQIRGPVRINDKEMSSQNVEDRLGASPNNDVNLKENALQAQKKPVMKKYPNIRLESKVVNVLCNDAESTLKEKGAEGNENHLHLQKLTSVTYPLSNVMEAKVLDFQPSSCTVIKAKKSLPKTTILDLSSSLCKISEGQGHTPIDTIGSRSEEQNNSKRHNISIETPGIACAITSEAELQNQNTAVYSRAEEMQDMSTWSTNDQRTVQTLLEQEREKNVEIGKQTGMLISECSGLGTLIIDEENSHRIVDDGNVSLHDQDSDSKEVSRDGHNLLNIIAQNSVSVIEGFSCSKNMGSTVFEDEFNQPIEGTKYVMGEEIYNNGKDTESKESVLDVQETNNDEKDDLDMKNFTARINVDCQRQDLNSVDGKRAESSEERHAQKVEKQHQRGFDVNQGGTSMKGFEFEGFVKVRKIEREMTKAVKDDICSESVDCLVQKQTCKGVPESSGVKENTSDSLLQSDYISHSQVKMTSLLTISGALGCKKQLLIVPRSYLTVELVMAAISLGKFSYKDIHSWVCKICRPVNRDFTEVNRKQFLQYELLHKIISKSCDTKKRSHWEEILKKTLYVLPRGEGWSLIFEKIPDICQDLVTCDSGFSNITKKKTVTFLKKYRSNTVEEKLELVVKKLQQKSTQVKVLRGKQMSASRELKNIKEKLQEKINGLRAFIKVHGGRNPDSYLKPSSSKNQKAEKNFITETEEVLANLYELVGEKEMKNGELQQEVADLKVVIDEKDKEIQQKNKLGPRTEAKAVIPMESMCEKKQKDHVLHIKHLQGKLRKTKEMIGYEELCSSRLREELRTQRQLLGEKDRIIAHNEKKIADLKSDAISCRSFHGQLEHKLHVAHCSLQERDVYIRSLEDQYYGISQELKMANFNLQEKISVIQQQQNLLDQQKERYLWSCIDNKKNQGKQNGNELVSHYMEEYNKHLADLENRLIQCNNILSEKENFIKQLQKNFSDYQAFVKERESQLAASRICQKCSEPASKFDCELPSSSWVQLSDEKNPTEGELLARKDEKLRSAYKRVQELHGEVEYLVERTKAGSSTSDLKETLEMKRKNAALQQCIITREEMNAQLEEKLSVQNKELAHFKEQLQMKSTIIEYLQNFIVDKEPITVNTGIENVGISGNTKAENKSNGNCERDKDRDFLGSDPVHSPLMKSSVGQVESQSCCSNLENAKNSPQIGECLKVQQGVLITQKEISAPDKKDMGIYQNKTDTETGSYCAYKKKESTNIASLFEKVPQAESRKTFKENVGSYSNINVGSQKTMNLQGESQSYSGVFTYEKHCNTTFESSKLIQGQKTSDITLEHRRVNLEINVPESSEKQFLTCDPEKGICDQADPKLQLPKCEQGRNIEAADGERKTIEEKDSKETEKPSPVKITYSEYCMRNKNKIFLLSTSNNNNETVVGRERLYSSENLSQESGWHGVNYSNITQERKHQNLEAGYGEMGRKRNLSKEMTLEIEQTSSKESKRSKFDVDKKGKVLPVKENTAKIPPRIPDESKTSKIKIQETGKLKAKILWKKLEN